MNTAQHTGNVTLILADEGSHRNALLLLGLKKPKEQAHEKRRRKKVGSGCWVPPGGGTETSDRNQKHAARREVLQETGLWFPLSDFKKAAFSGVTKILPRSHSGKSISTSYASVAWRKA